MLYLIEILHQTTTQDSQGLHFRRCILLKFYIKPQRRGRTTFSCVSCILLKFYIKPQRFAYWNILVFGCILLKFYIKPQHLLLKKEALLVVSY